MNNNAKTNKMSAEQNQPLTIQGLSHDGRGIGFINNKTTFVSGALPEETVTYKLTERRSTYNQAEVCDVLIPAATRVTPPCAHFGVCGGCSLQHISIEKQLELKQHTLLEQLKHFGKVVPTTLLAPLHATSVGYRRKARLGAKFVIKKDKMLVGFREKSSRYLADLNECAVLHPSVGKKLPELSQLIASLSIYQHIPQIEVAIGDDTTALIFRHLEDLNDDDKAKLVAFGKMHHYHIYLQPNAPAPLSKLWPDDGKARLTYSLPSHHLEFLFHPLDFTQINLEINRLMVDQAIALLTLEANDNVLDLFCGLGNFTLPIARYVNSVTGVEGSLDMVDRAKENAQHNQLPNTEFYMANLMEPQSSPWLKRDYNKILLDPPRVGAKEIIPHLNHASITKIVYVSCNPATLARDAGELVHVHGYELKQAGIMNMFPHTAHIEAMAVFEK